MKTWANTQAQLPALDLQAKERFGIKPGLSRMHRLLTKMGSPERRLRFIHVAGTNGKGSTCAYIESVLRYAGYRTGLYTSPFAPGLRSSTEVSGQGISAVAAKQYHEQLKKVIERDVALSEDQPTQFELETVAALLHFVAQQVEIVIWEVGLGGQYDATNVVTSEVTIITNVAMDHMLFLGSQVENIARHKAGIIQPNCLVVTAATGPAQYVIDSVARVQGSPVAHFGTDFRVTVERVQGFLGQRITYYGARYDVSGVWLAMLGPHQSTNAAIALRALEELEIRGFVIGEDAVRRGLLNARWPGRLEVVRTNPLLLLDGAHNPHGAKALAQALHVLGVEHYVLVAGVLADKDMDGVLQPLASKAAAVFTTQARVLRAARAEHVADIARAHTLPGVTVKAVGAIADCLEEAIQSARSFGTSTGVVVMGTLYTVSEAREVLCMTTSEDPSVFK